MLAKFSSALCALRVFIYLISSRRIEWFLLYIRIIVQEHSPSHHIPSHPISLCIVSPHTSSLLSLCYFSTRPHFIASIRSNCELTLTLLSASHHHTSYRTHAWKYVCACMCVKDFKKKQTNKQQQLKLQQKSLIKLHSYRFVPFLSPFFLCFFFISFFTWEFWCSSSSKQNVAYKLIIFVFCNKEEKKHKLRKNEQCVMRSRTLMRTKEFLL